MFASRFEVWVDESRGSVAINLPDQNMMIGVTHVDESDYPTLFQLAGDAYASREIESWRKVFDLHEVVAQPSGECDCSLETLMRQGCQCGKG